MKEIYNTWNGYGISCLQQNELDVNVFIQKVQFCWIVATSKYYSVKFTN